MKLDQYTSQNCFYEKKVSVKPARERLSNFTNAKLLKNIRVLNEEKEKSESYASYQNLQKNQHSASQQILPKGE